VPETPRRSSGPANAPRAAAPPCWGAPSRSQAAWRKDGAPRAAARRGMSFHRIGDELRCARQQTSGHKQGAFCRARAPAPGRAGPESRPRGHDAARSAGRLVVRNGAIWAGSNDINGHRSCIAGRHDGGGNSRQSSGRPLGRSSIRSTRVHATVDPVAQFGPTEIILSVVA